MRKYYFELDKVETITLTHERESEYRWFSEIPARPKTFLGIKYGMSKTIPAGWNEDYEVEENMSHHRKQSSYFEDYPWYRVDFNRIYYRAEVTVSLGYKQSISTRFESNEEAQAYVDDLILGSDKKFHIIIQK